MRAPRPRRKPHAPRAPTAATTRVSEIMSPNVTTVRTGTSLETLSELLLSHGLSRVPVIDATGRLIGIVSKTDLVEHAHDQGDTSEANRAGGVVEPHGFHVHEEPASVDDVMSHSIVAVGETETVQRAARLMVGARVHGLPVVTTGGRLSGFVSTTDVLAWLSGLR